MATVIDNADIIVVCNQALGLLGAATISINGTDNNHDLCTLFWAQARDEILINHPWNFARKRANAIQTTDPLFEYDYAFTKPSDCLRVLRIAYDPNKEFRVEGNLILTNTYDTPDNYDDDGVSYLAGQYITSDISGSDLTYLVDTAFTSSDETTDISTYCTSAGGDYYYLPVEYIYQVTDVTDWPSFAIQCLILNLAIKLVPALKANERVAMNLQQSLHGGKNIIGIMGLARSLDAQESAVTEIKTNKWLDSRR